MTDKSSVSSHNSVPKIVKLLKQASDAYYNSDTPIMTDAEFDQLRETLEQKDPNNKFLQEIGAPPVSKDAVELPFYMASLDKIKEAAKLSTWTAKYPGPYVLMDKLDGVSGLLYVDSEKKVKLYTRGDITHGQDITHLIKYIFQNINLELIPANTAIRGEIIMSKTNFDTISQQFKNARNTISGLVNSKHFNKDVAKITDFIAYSVIYPEMTMSEQLKKIKSWGIPFVTNKTIKTRTIDIDTLSNYYSTRRQDSDYEIDGIVVTDTKTIQVNSDSNPNYAFAFKMTLNNQIAQTKVIDVEWAVSKRGMIKPRISIEPVNICGVTISYATAFNAKYVYDNVLGPGAIIKIIRSGDVIPHILEIIKPADNNKPKMPDIDYVWNETGVDILVNNPDENVQDEILVKQISDFFRIMGIKNISQGIVTKMVNAGYKSVRDILNADPDDLATIDGIGNKMVDKIRENTLNVFKDAKLHVLMDASSTFERGLGSKKLKIVLDNYPNILKEKWTKTEMKDNIKKLDGFDEITANQFVKYINSFKEFIKDLETVEWLRKDIIRIQQVKQNDKPVGNLFAGQKIVFTGFRDKALEDFIVQNGGQVTGSVSKNTNILVYTDQSSSKYEKAVELGIKTFTPTDFKHHFGL